LRLLPPSIEGHAPHSERTFFTQSSATCCEQSSAIGVVSEYVSIGATNVIAAGTGCHGGSAEKASDGAPLAAPHANHIKRLNQGQHERSLPFGSH
jgi:hypothetical protein